MAAIFRDRFEAGRDLANVLDHYRDKEDALVLALPRGGVPVGVEIALALHLPLDVFIVRKLGVPGREELAMGALAPGGVRVFDNELIRSFNIPDETITEICQREQSEIERRERQYRVFPAKQIKRKSILLVDDGLATGSTMLAAVRAIRKSEPSRITVAVPVAAAETVSFLRSVADEVVALYTPEPFRAVGIWYEDFSQTTDEEVRFLLEQGERAHALKGD